jgi:hypothetical protein
MAGPIRILLQTTIPYTEDDWHIGRFSLLENHLRTLKDENGEPLYDVTARDRDADPSRPDPLLTAIDSLNIDELWLLAPDAGNGLTAEECAAITQFRQRGGGVLTARDHNDLGSSICNLGGVGGANYFYSINPDPDPAKRCRDDQETQSIDYPNYHSGANGDYQSIKPLGELHEILYRPDGSAIEYFPAHPHEGGVGVPEGDVPARVIAAGTSKATGRLFNLIVAFENGPNGDGRGLAHASFHHFADYNWNISMGCPSGVTEAPGNEIERYPERLNDIKLYVANVAKWLAPDKTAT